MSRKRRCYGSEDRRGFVNATQGSRPRFKSATRSHQGRRLTLHSRIPALCGVFHFNAALKKPVDESVQYPDGRQKDGPEAKEFGHAKRSMNRRCLARSWRRGLRFEKVAIVINDCHRRLPDLVSKSYASQGREQPEFHPAAHQIECRISRLRYAF